MDQNVTYDNKGSHFEGWALIELFGHQREAGFVTTQYYGDKAMFQIDIPEIEAQQETIERPRWDDSRLLAAGTVIERASIPGRTRIVNPGAVYALNPATEQAVRVAISRNESRAVRVISIPTAPQLAAGHEVPVSAGSIDEEDDGQDYSGRDLDSSCGI